MSDSPFKSELAAIARDRVAPGRRAAMAKPAKPDQLGGLRRFALAISIFTILGHLWFGFEQSYVQPLASLASAYATQLLLDALEAWTQRRRPRFLNGFGSLVNSLLSAHISGLACAMLLYANDHIWVVCFASATAIASKTLFRAPVGSAKGAWPMLVFQFALFVILLQAGDATSRLFPIAPRFLPAFRLGALAVLLASALLFPPTLPTRHYLNPSNFGITVTLLLFTWVGIAAPYQFTQNLGRVGHLTVPLAIICTGSFLNTWYTRRIPLALAWIGTFALQAIVSSLILWFTTGYCPLAARLSAMTGVAFVLFTFYMVTDPATTPERPVSQVVFGASVALIYSVFLMSHVVFGLFMALVIVCTARGLGMFLTAYLQSLKPASAGAPALEAMVSVKPGLDRRRST